MLVLFFWGTSTIQEICLLMKKLKAKYLTVPLQEVVGEGVGTKAWSGSYAKSKPPLVSSVEHPMAAFIFSD